MTTITLTLKAGDLVKAKRPFHAYLVGRGKRDSRYDFEPDGHFKPGDMFCVAEAKSGGVLGHFAVLSVTDGQLYFASLQISDDVHRHEADLFWFTKV